MVVDPRAPVVGMNYPWPWRGLSAITALTLITAWACWQVDIHPGRLFSSTGMTAAWDQAARLLTPSMRIDVWLRLGEATLSTLALATAGSIIAALISLALLPFASVSLMPSRILRHVACLLANALRTIPYLVWALVLIMMLGLGPKPAAIALGLHTGGVLTRLFTGAVDSLNQAPLNALRHAGASRLGLLLFGVLPQVRAQLLSIWLYRWEINLREATVLGMVAAGGLGHELAMAFGQFKYQTVSAALCALVLLVLAGESLSAWLRRRTV